MCKIRSTSPVCACPREHPAPAGIGLVGWFDPEFSGSHLPGRSHGFLGSTSPAHSRAFPPPAAWETISAKLLISGATSGKGLFYSPFTQGDPGAENETRDIGSNLVDLTLEKGSFGNILKAGDMLRWFRLAEIKVLYNFKKYPALLYISSMKKKLGIALVILFTGGMWIAFILLQPRQPALFITSPFIDQQVTSNFQTSTASTTVSPLATNSVIAFTQRDQNGDSHIYTMNVDGSDVTNLVNCFKGECYPSWSPDGTKIVFQRQEDGVGIYVMNADGSHLRRLSPTPGFDFRPSWSPDGSQIIFNRVTNPPILPGQVPKIAIMAMNSDGTNTRTILGANGTYNLEPRWSPDGTKIVFMSGLDGTQQIYTMNPDGKNVTKITNKGMNGDPVWSPDGSKISFGSNREGGDRLNIFTMNPDGSDVKQVTHFLPPYEAGDTSWSPDGARIVFEWDMGGKHQSDPNVRAEVWIVNVDGTGEMSTGQPCSAVGCSPRWQPVKK